MADRDFDFFFRLNPRVVGLALLRPIVLCSIVKPVDCERNYAMRDPRSESTQRQRWSLALFHGLIEAVLFKS